MQDKKQQNEFQYRETKIFPVPYDLEEIKENIFCPPISLLKNSKTDCDISIIIESNNIFNKIFFPFCNELSNRLNKLGFNSNIKWGDNETEARKIILGAHSNPIYWKKYATNKDIIINFETIYKDSWRKINHDYFELLCQHCVFDYCDLNLPYLRESHSFKTPPFYSDFKPKKKKLVDVIFVGSTNKYRINILRKLYQSGINTEIKFNIFGDDLINSIDESRIYLNIDWDENCAFNIFRFMSCAQTNTLFAGHSGNIKYYPKASKLLGLSLFKNDLELIEGVKRLLSDKYYMSEAFAAQYEVAMENSKYFDLFVRNQFIRT